MTRVRLKHRGTIRFPSSGLQVAFGARLATNVFTNKNGDIEVSAPYLGRGANVPVTVKLPDGTVLTAPENFSSEIGSVSVTGPQQEYLRWYDGGSLNGFSGAVPANSSSPSYHVSVDMTGVLARHLDPPAPYVWGDKLHVGIGVWECKAGVSGPTSSSCTHWSGAKGQWSRIEGGGTLDLVNPGPGPGRSDSSVTGDLLVNIPGLFNTMGDAFDTVRTIRFSIAMEERDSSGWSPSTDWRKVELRTGEMDVIYEPTALFQIKALPYTILYQPPGNQSGIKYTEATTYSTQYKIADSRTVGSKSSVQNSSSMDFTIKGSLRDIDALKQTLGGFGGTSKGEELWDRTTSTGQSQQNDSEAARTDSLASSVTFQLAPNTCLIPGSGEECADAGCTRTIPSPANTRPNAYMNEPFWDDLFVFQVHPQFAAWATEAGPATVVYVGSARTAALARVRQLDACARGVKPLGLLDPCVLNYQNQVVVNDGGETGYKSVAASIKLRPGEAQNFLELDPFYGAGQSATLKTHRAEQLPGFANVEFGSISPAHSPMTVSRNVTAKVTQSTTATEATDTTTTVTTSFSSGYSFGFSLFDLLSFSKSEKTKTTEENSLKISYKTSTQRQEENSTSANVDLLDKDSSWMDKTNNPSCSKVHGRLPRMPATSIYLDRLYGTFMFQDALAPAGMAVMGEITPGSEAPPAGFPLLLQMMENEARLSRFSDVSSDNPLKSTVGILAAAGIMSGYPDGAFHPEKPLSRGELTMAVVTATQKPLTTIATPYQDVPRSSWLAPYAGVAHRDGLVLTESATKLDIAHPVTRQELMTILNRAFPPRASAGTQPRVLQPAGGATGAVGRPGRITRLEPLPAPGAGETPITRGEAATVLLSAVMEHLNPPH